MSGHNKWTQIKRQKAVEDGKKSKAFSLLARVITLEVKKSNGDREAPGVKRAIEKAHATNMPNDNIERAIKTGTGAGSENFEEVLYEAYAPGGVALIIEGITGNKNRTSQEVKHLLAEHGSSLAASGSATWAFEKSPAGGWQAKTLVEITESDKARLESLIVALENNEDIKNIYDNYRH